MLAGFGQGRFQNLSNGDTAVSYVNFLTKASFPSIGFEGTVFKVNALPNFNLTKVKTGNSLTTQPLAHMFNTSRALSSFSFIGNRLGLIHKHMTSASELPKHLTSRSRIAFKLNKLIKQDANFNFMHVMKLS